MQSDRHVWSALFAACGALWIYSMHRDPRDDLHRAKANRSAAAGTYVKTYMCSSCGCKFSANSMKRMQLKPSSALSFAVIGLMMPA